MPKLLCSPTSPYSAKVRLAATYAGIPFETVLVEAAAEPAVLLDANPLGKIPTWITDEGTAIFDSRVITQYLNRVSPNALYPRNADKRLAAEQLESLADGICDAAFNHVMERRRPQDKIHDATLDKQWRKVERALDRLAAGPPRLGTKITGGDIALRAALGYLKLRFEGKWEKKRGKLTRWLARFDEKFPELAKLY